MLLDIASSIMARTTVDLDTSILDELRYRAKHEGKSMGQVASELLAQAFVQQKTDETSKASFGWVKRDLGKPLVDLEDKEAVRSLLDGRH